MALSLMGLVDASAKSRAAATIWFKPFKDADLTHLLDTAVPQLTEVLSDPNGSPQDRLTAAHALKMVAAAVEERIVETL